MFVLPLTPPPPLSRCLPPDPARSRDHDLYLFPDRAEFTRCWSLPTDVGPLQRVRAANSSLCALYQLGAPRTRDLLSRPSPRFTPPPDRRLRCPEASGSFCFQGSVAALSLYNSDAKVFLQLHHLGLLPFLVSACTRRLALVS